MSSVNVPGNTALLEPSVPGLILDPADLPMKLIAEPELPAAIVKLPITIEESLLPVVVSKVILAAVPLVLAVKLMAPIWLISLFEVKLMLEPLRAVMMPL